MLEGWLSFNGSGWYILALKGVEGDDTRIARGLLIQHAMVALLVLQWWLLEGMLLRNGEVLAPVSPHSTPN